MTNYNDGNWHGWNGGEFPVHPKSEVDVVIRDPDGFTRSDAWTVDSFRWEHLVDCANIIAFRVVKEHREPMEFWIHPDGRMWTKKPRNSEAKKFRGVLE